MKYVDSTLGSVLPIWVLILPLYPPYHTSQAHHTLRGPPRRPTSPACIPAPESLSHHITTATLHFGRYCSFRKKATFGDELIFHYQMPGVKHPSDSPVTAIFQECEEVKWGLSSPEALMPAFSQAVCAQGQPRENPQPALSTWLMLPVPATLLQQASPWMKGSFWQRHCELEGKGL